MTFKRRARVGHYTVEKTGREDAAIGAEGVSIHISLETLADGKSVCVYPSQCIIEHGEEGLTLEDYLPIAVQGLSDLGYRIEVAK